MKKALQSIATLYAQNGKFHSFVNAVLVGLGAGISAALVGGIPLNKSGWLVAGGVVTGALKGALTGWLRDNIAVASVQGVGATVAQSQAVAATAAVNTNTKPVEVK